MGRLVATLLSLSLLSLAAHGAFADAQTMLHPTVTPVKATSVTEGLPAPELTLGTALRNIAARAGTIFAGQVVRIEHKPGVVEVTFTVQQAVQGVAGPTYTLREWAGLWTVGAPRYVLGQRAMVFLNPVNEAGFSSPVDGMEGVVPLVPMGANAPAMLDVRRLATRLQRAPGQPLSAEAIALPDAVATVMSSTPTEPKLRLLPVGWKPVMPTPIGSPILTPVVTSIAGARYVAR